MGTVAKRFEVYLLDLPPAIGAEIKKTRPCKRGRLRWINFAR